MKFWLLLLCAVFIACNQTGIAETVAPKDSMTTFLIDRATSFMYKDDMDTLGQFLDSIHPYINERNDDGLKLTWELHKVQQLRRQEKADSVEEHWKIALALAKSPNITKRQLLNFYIVYGNYITGRQLMDSALQLANSAYYLSIQLDSFRYAETCYDLSELYYRTDDTVNAKKYIFEAWRRRKEEPDQILYIAGAIAAHYAAANQVDSALFFIKKFDEDSSLIWNVDLRVWQHDTKSYFLAQQERYEEVIAELLKAKDINESNNRDKTSNYFDLSEAYMLLKRYEKAFEYIDSARTEAKINDSFGLVKEAWKIKAGMYASLNQYKAAYAALDSAYAAYDVEMDTSFRERAREIEAKYSVREKDAEIKALADSNSKSLKIREQQGVIIATLSIVAVLASITGVLLWNRRQNQIRVREADLRQQVLRAQMEPHFSFNMLGLLQAFIRANDQESATLLLNRFSRLLRSVLENARKRFVKLSDEISVLESYLGLQQMLLESKFEFRIEIEPGIKQDSVWVPPMLLQPFAENAITHGFKGSPGKHELIIKVGIRQSSLHFTVDDNGSGLDIPTVKTKRLHAIEITHQRLSILRKEARKKTRLEIIDKKLINEGSGVRVEMDVPYQSANLD